MAILLSDEHAAEMVQEIRSLMHRWSPSDRYADYECGFCSQRPPTNHGNITHDETCYGEKALKLLQPPIA